jgi:hypothetical protein
MEFETHSARWIDGDRTHRAGELAGSDELSRLRFAPAAAASVQTKKVFAVAKTPADAKTPATVKTPGAVVAAKTPDIAAAAASATGDKFANAAGGAAALILC